MKEHSTSSPFDEDRPITQADIDAGRLIPRQRAADGHILPKEQSVTLYLDTAVIAHFKRLAGDHDYRGLINETLKMGLAQDSLENLLRRVIREEITHSGTTPKA